MSLSREQIQKHQKEIIAFGEGKAIEGQIGSDTWTSAPLPSWHINSEYRVKPEPKKPKFGFAYRHIHHGNFYHADSDYRCKNMDDTEVFPFVTRTAEIDELLKSAGYELPEEGGDK